MHFDDLNLIPPLLSAMRDMGYDQPTPIQRETIPSVLAGRDVPVSYTHLTLPTIRLV